MSTEKPFAATALGPADVRDTPQVKPTFPTAAEQTATDSDDPWVGQTLSNVYVIETKIGEGGMGRVYLARHVHLRKPFALKVLTESVGRRDNAVDRLRQEAVAASSIDHENIVDVVNFDRAGNGAVFIVMEYLKGESLAASIGRGPIELRRAVPIAFQICRALAAAHQREIVHRDLKPENIFLTQKRDRTVVKVLDFGISKVKSADAEKVRMTKTGQLVGTPLYMSPEQARGEENIDRRVDIYALGVILFEMLSGAPPFEGRNYFELLWKHGNDPPPRLKDRNPNLHFSEELEAVIHKALAKDPDDRFQSMDDFEHALALAAPDVSRPPNPVSLPPERPKDAALERSTAPDALAPPSARPPFSRKASTEAVQLPRSRALPALAVGAGIAILGVVAWIALSSPDTDDSPATETTTTGTQQPPPRAEAETTPAEEPPRAPLGVDPPAPVSFQVLSQPPGASVSLGEQRLGETPLLVQLPASDEAVELSLTKSGYRGARVSVIVREGVEVPPVRLTRRNRTESSGRQAVVKTEI